MVETYCMDCHNRPSHAFFASAEVAIDDAIDAADEETLLRLKREWPEAVFVSARAGRGVEDLRAAIEARLPRPAVELSAAVPYSRGDLVARVHRRGVVLSTTHTPEGTLLRVRVDEALAALEAEGVISRQNFSCCGSCGSSEIWDEIAAQSPRNAKVVQILKDYAETMQKAGPPYRYS